MEGKGWKVSHSFGWSRLDRTGGGVAGVRSGGRGVGCCLFDGCAGFIIVVVGVGHAGSEGSGSDGVAVWIVIIVMVEVW